MKIVHILSGKVWGGAEQYALDLGAELRKRGHSILYICGMDSVVETRLRHQGVDYEAIHFPNRFIGRSDILTSLMDGADIIHLHSKKMLRTVRNSLKSIDKKPAVVLTKHEARTSRIFPPFRRLYHTLDAMIYVSEFTHSEWTKRNKWYDPNRQHTILNSVPPLKAADHTESLRQHFGISASTPLLVFTGRIRKSKGCATIVRALGRVKDLPFVMVFIGRCKPSDYDNSLTALASELGIADRIHFYGFSDDAPALASQADIGIQPSIVREACGLSAMEFLQAGIPLITTGNGAQREYIIDGATGLLITPDSPTELSDALRKLLTDSSLREKIGTNAKRYFHENLGYTSFVDKIENVYKAIQKNQ